MNLRMPQSCQFGQVVDKSSHEKKKRLVVGVDVSHLLGCLNSNYLSQEIGSQYTNQLPKIEEQRIYKMMNKKDCSCEKIDV